MIDSDNNYEEIISDRSLFNKAVYTHLSDALRLLEERRNDPELVEKVLSLLKNDIPNSLLRKKCAIHFRQIATPNEEGRRFVSLALESNLQPVFFEYYNDKFTSNNEFKHSLGQLRIHGGVNKRGEYPSEKNTIVDFNKHNGKKLKEVSTLWDEPLVDFHRRLFGVYGVEESRLDFFDASTWFETHGKNASEYYTDFFLLFTCFGVLFENFLLDGTEGEFSKNVVLPAIANVYELTGLKPLIVPILPIDTEKDEHSISYDVIIKSIIR